MPKSTLAVVEREIELVLGPTSYARVVKVGRVILATPNSGGDPYIRLERYGDDGRIHQYKWNADVADWSTMVSTNPSSEPRWLEEI